VLVLLATLVAAAQPPVEGCFELPLGPDWRVSPWAADQPTELWVPRDGAGEEPVRALGEGVVVRAGRDEVWVRHRIGDGAWAEAVLGGLEAVEVRTGERVDRGRVLGRVGEVGLRLGVRTWEEGQPALEADPHLFVFTHQWGCPEVPAAGPTLEELSQEAGLGRPPPGLWLHVDKAGRTMSACSGDRELSTWDVGLGFEPVGDKVRLGDGRTPEGTFAVIARNPESSFHLSFGLSYPDAEDAERGLAAGLITEEQAEAIVAADHSGAIPPWNTSLGGNIAIHGGGPGYDWTLGCIAVDDVVMDQLWEVTRTGTRVRIEPALGREPCTVQ